MQTLAPVLQNGTKTPPLNPSSYLSTTMDGTNYNYVTSADLVSAPLNAGVSAVPNTPIVQIFNGSFTFQPNFFGIVSSSTSLLSGVTFGTRRLQDSCSVGWSDINTSNGVYNAAAVSRLDAYVADATAKGYDLIWVIQSCPTWAATGGVKTNCPTSFAYLATMINWLMGRYGNSIKYIEGWNEPNVTQGYTDTVANLVTFQQTIWNAVQAFNTANSTSIKVISPSFSMRSGVGTLDTPATVNFDAFLVAGGGVYCDVIGCHPYTQRDYLAYDRTVLPAINASMSARSVSKPLWVTEVGDSAPNANAIMQAFLWSAAYGAQRCVWYSWDQSTGGAHGDMSNVGQVGITAWNKVVQTLSGKTLTGLNSTTPTSFAVAFGQACYSQLGCVFGGVGLTAP